MEEKDKEDQDIEKKRFVLSEPCPSRRSMVKTIRGSAKTEKNSAAQTVLVRLELFTLYPQKS